MKNYNRVLTIAGSDSGGGAGIQADIKTISALGCYAASAITAVTVQNTCGVDAVHPIPIEIINGEISSVLTDIGADAIKIGMLHSSEVVHTVAESLKRFNMKNIVVDPVMVSTSGHRLIEESAVEALKNELLPMADIITPNIPEAEILLGEKVVLQSDMPLFARKLGAYGNKSVFLKAGHMEDDQVEDVFYNAVTDKVTILKSRRITTRNSHGTGCTLSSALAAFLARGYSLEDAAYQAKEYISKAIEKGAEYAIGHGFGPVCHFWNFWG
ncbi:MAG: bifunctional hydroxymethylpyrimidine kinase/phosphomethylpyrimidine kinase [Bacteroidales bacterium]|nr:bifunctional hydroxymethylpyrimidine kinase/phosphomethylpyrimidine kinase [Bacteroidales bacterium]